MRGTKHTNGNFAAVGHQQLTDRFHGHSKCGNSKNCATCRRRVCDFGAQSAGRGDYVDVDLLRSVEILRGPASALYGSDGVAGAVSFITKDPIDILGADDNFGGRARVTYSSADESLSESALSKSTA